MDRCLHIVIQEVEGAETQNIYRLDDGVDPHVSHHSQP